MDPDETYFQMYQSMVDSNYDTARQYATELRNWLDKGGCFPQKYSRVEVKQYLASVLRKTATSTGQQP